MVGSGTATQYSYLGLSGELTGEANTGSGLNKAYAYTPGGQRLFQYTPGTTATSPGYYSYNDHHDVEAVTGTGGTTTATYGYTAYGQPDPGQFTGADKNNTQPGTTAPFNAYRFNAMRWDPSSGQYDMGFRNYAPSLNQFLSRDMYNGALADMTLTTDPFTGNRYTFAAGNPITNIELDGHSFPGGGGAAGCPYGTPGCLPSPPPATPSGSSQCSRLIPNCTNPCVRYPGSCTGTGTQLNEGTQPVQRKPSIWNMLPGACGYELIRISCPNLAATGDDGGSQPGEEGSSPHEGSSSSSDGIDWLDLLRAGIQAAVNTSRDLGMDPATGAFRQGEYDTALRIQLERGVALQRSANPSVDWVDANGNTYDAVGNFSSKYFDRQWPNLQTRILDHMTKADFVPVDVSGFTEGQIAQVQQFIDPLGPAVFMVGQ